MTLKRALVFSGGTWDVEQEKDSPFLRGPWSWIVCADSGARHALRLQYRPDVLVGDLDSIDEQDRLHLQDVPYVRAPNDQEKTDTHIAVDWAVERGADDIVVVAGLGTRFDHSLANAHLLVTLHRRNVKGVVTDGRQAVYVLLDELRLEAPAGATLSVLPLTDRLDGLTVEGARWELYEQCVNMGETLTVSNECSGNGTRLTLKSGMALVVVGLT